MTKNIFSPIRSIIKDAKRRMFILVTLRIEKMKVI